MKRITSMVLLMGAVGVGSACSQNATGPAVSFTAPRGQGPSNNAIFRFNQQPVTLTIFNAMRTGPATVTYTVELATSDSFATIFRTVEGIAETPGETTSVTVSNLPGATTFFWRWKAVIDGTAGQPSPPGSFFVRPQVTLGLPDAEEPRANANVYDPRPTFQVRNGSRTGPVGAITYEFEVSTVSTFASTVARATGVAEQATRTTWRPAAEMPEGTLFWRARAVDSLNDEVSAWTTGLRFERRRGIDLGNVVYQFGANISGWAETSQITEAYHNGSQLCIFHTKLGVWPVTDFFEFGPILEGNQQIFALINGTWYSGSSEWYRPGQACKAVNNAIGHESFPGANPLGGWVPRHGETFGVMATTPGRMWPSFKTLDQRSNVALIQWYDPR